MRITRHFVTVGKRRVHYLRAGSGPALALLHACPVSAKVMIPLMPVFGEKFTCLAFDMPGFGLSDKLPQPKPSIEDFADALAETLDALGVKHVSTYGRHTGASIAVVFAERHPKRCAMALADGYAVFAKFYSDEELDRYLEPLVPVWDGTHLLHLWARYRDQHVFWPWNNQSAAGRSDADVPDVDFLHRGVVEMLEAGDDYRIGYAAPFRHRALDVIPNLKVPVCFGNRPGDSMWRTRALYPASAWQEAIPREHGAATLREREILQMHPPRGTPPPAPQATPLPGRTTINYVDGMLVRSANLGPCPTLVVHHAPGSSFLYDSLVLALGNALAADLPGHGESDPLPGNPQSVDAWTSSMERLLDRMNIRELRVYGHNGGAAVAVELAHRLGSRVRGVVLDAPAFVPDAQMASRYAPPVQPTWDGSHWLRAWHHIRDSELWWPWFERKHQNVRKTARIDPQALTIPVREAMKQPASYEPAWQAALSYDWRKRLAALPNLLTIAAPEDVFAHLMPAKTVEDNAASRARAIKEWME
jgi:pimeloyl-ACP methyl ester carboxylesterase